MKVIIFHPQGNANVRCSAIGLAEAGLLAEYHTSIACFEGSILDKVAEIGFLSDIKRRKLDLSLKPFTHTSPFREIGRIISKKTDIKFLTKPESGIFSVLAVAQNLDKKVASVLKDSKRNGISCVYAYEDAALFSFSEAKHLGLNCIYDLPTGYWRAKSRILDEEKRKFPEWQATITGLFDSEIKLLNKDKEIEMADVVFVASKFTAATLKDYPGKLPPVEIIPYGFPDTGPRKQYPEKNLQSPVNLLFVGNLSQQKGIANLFQVAEELGNQIKLTIVGQKAVNDCAVLNENLLKHHWIPSLPHHKILELMRESDVLVFPTMFDGFGLVMTEAMSQGTPVIATYNSAGPDLIENGRNGWLIEAGSTSALKAIIDMLIANPENIEKAGIEAMETARKRPWSVYKKELSEAVQKHFPSANKI